MNKLPVLKPGEVIHILEGAGFYVDHIRGSHYQMYHPLTRRGENTPLASFVSSDYNGAVVSSLLSCYGND